MNETLLRRLNERNLKSWGVPDLILIDGGKGQLDAALKARAEKNQNTPMIGLAKKQEQIILMKNSGIMLNYQKLNLLKGIMMESDSFITINLPTSSHIVKLLQRIRDESHRFAVSYHSVLKRRKMTDSDIEAIPSIGPATRKKLIKTLGSLKAVKETDDETLKNLVGEKKMKLLRQYL
jgi:excinuclease ABC subunit C